MAEERSTQALALQQAPAVVVPQELAALSQMNDQQVEEFLHHILTLPDTERLHNYEAIVSIVKIA
jgi:hypothetical protein